jgi:hypothetical protein
MNEFNDILSGWKNQAIPSAANNATDITKMAQKRITDSRKKHIATIVILGITCLVLVAFAISAGTQSSLFVAGIGLMISALAVRIGVEWWSSGQLKKLDVGDNANIYLKHLVGFYQMRKKIHGLFTAITFSLYVLGFVVLLPIFKANLPHGFFVYIIVSGIVIFGSLIYFIRKKINEELKNLDLTITELSSIAKSFEV